MNGIAENHSVASADSLVFTQGRVVAHCPVRSQTSPAHNPKHACIPSKRLDEHAVNMYL